MAPRVLQFDTPTLSGLSSRPARVVARTALGNKLQQLAETHPEALNAIEIYVDVLLARLAHSGNDGLK